MSIIVWKATRKPNKKNKTGYGTRKNISRVFGILKVYHEGTWKHRASSAKSYSKHLLNCIACLLYSWEQHEVLHNLCWASTKVSRTSKVSSVSTVKTAPFSSLTLICSLTLLYLQFLYQCSWPKYSLQWFWLYKYIFIKSKKLF